MAIVFKALIMINLYTEWNTLHFICNTFSLWEFTSRKASKIRDPWPFDTDTKITAANLQNFSTFLQRCTLWICSVMKRARKLNIGIKMRTDLLILSWNSFSSAMHDTRPHYSFSLKCIFRKSRGIIFQRLQNYFLQDSYTAKSTYAKHRS